MNFGEKLRQLRNEKGLTQPELANAMGIEQSYLSKLENDKSLPSNDVLNRILDVFEIGVARLVDDLDQGSRNQLRQIPDVADHYNHQKQQLIGNRKRWLLISAVLLSFGLGLFHAGNSHLFFSDVVYQYQSHGVVLEGEPKEIFSSPGRFMPNGGDREEANEYMNSINARLDEVFLQERVFLGDAFNVEVEGGSRTYYLTSDTEVDPWQSKLVVFFGVIMTVLGIFGVVLERKLSHSS